MSILLPEKNDSSQKVKIIGISGVSGAGKTTLARQLGETLNATTLFWDDYDPISTGPEDYVAWYHSHERNTNAWHYEALEHVLQNLKNKKSICCPATQRLLVPTSLIIFDAPMGYSHQATGQYIDFLIFLDTAPDIALARRLLRDSGVQNFVEELHYYLDASRPVYLSTYEERENSDLIVDGNLSIQDQEALILSALKVRDPQLLKDLPQQKECKDEMKSVRQVSRMGVYGVVVQNQKILLIKKKGGCYKGLLDLPGGGIEFGESPEETLRREFIEEVAMSFKEMCWMKNLSHTKEIGDGERSTTFHHLGLIYYVLGEAQLAGLQPEEQFDWYSLTGLDLQTLTPFAQIIVRHHQSILGEEVNPQV
jgi:uridine kinase/ADP-ribose pyrophosphatase YjhB (NUDIX family)